MIEPRYVYVVMEEMTDEGPIVDGVFETFEAALAAVGGKVEQIVDGYWARDHHRHHSTTIRREVLQP